MCRMIRGRNIDPRRSRVPFLAIPSITKNLSREREILRFAQDDGLNWQSSDSAGILISRAVCEYTRLWEQD